MINMEQLAELEKSSEETGIPISKLLDFYEISRLIFGGHIEHMPHEG